MTDKPFRPPHDEPGVEERSNAAVRRALTPLKRTAAAPSTRFKHPFLCFRCQDPLLGGGGGGAAEVATHFTCPSYGEDVSVDVAAQHRFERMLGAALPEDLKLVP